MNKKAKIIIAALIFIFLGLIIYAFAAPKNDEETLDNKVQQVEEDKNTSKDTDKKESKEESEDKEDEGTTTNTNKESKENTPEVVVDNGYDKAKAAVEKAQGSLDAEDVKAAEEAIGNVSGQDTKELTDALDKVKSDINAKELVEELEEMVNNAASKEDMDAARAFEDEKEVKNVVANVNNEDLKEVLEGTLEELSKLLDDKDAPVIDPVDGTITNKDVTINVNDKNKVVITLDGNEIENETEVTEEGTYTVVATDAAFNETTVTFTIDKTAPEVDVTEGKYYRSDLVAIATDENLDTITLNNAPYNKELISEDGEYTLVAKDKAGNTTTINFVVDKTAPTFDVEEGKYYNTDVEVNAEDKNLDTLKINGEEYNNEVITEEGKYTIVATDKAGNSAMVTFVVDKTAPTVDVTDGRYYNVSLAAIITDINFDKAILNNVEYTNNIIGVTAEGEYTLEMYDKAGNTNTIKFYVDKTAPTLKAANILVNGDSNDQSVFYATVGDQIYAYFRASEELQTPVFELVSDGTKYSMGEVTVSGPDQNNEYTYSATYTVNDTDMIDGEVTLSITNIKDLAGNVMSDITEPTNGHKVIVDRTAPTVDVKDERHYTSDLTAVITDTNYERATLNNVEYTDSKIGVGENGTYTLVMYDKAGNYSTIKFYVDKNLSTAYVTNSTEELTTGSVIVTINAYEKLKSLDGWNLSADKLSLTKEFTANAIGYITIESEDGDSKELSYNVSNIYSEVASENELKTTLGTTGKYNIKLTDDVELTSNLEVNKDSSLVLDLNNKTLKLFNDSNKRFVIEGNVIIKNGKIVDGTEYDGNSNSATIIRVKNGGSLTIDSNASVEGSYNLIWPSENSKLVVKGSVISNKGGAAIITNGSNVSAASITIEQGATITSGDDVAIYLPTGNLIVNGGTITGATGIAIKGGTATINGGVITGNGVKTAFVHNGNGWNNTGDAFAVENSDYPAAPPVVLINGGYFNSVNAEAVASYGYSTYNKITGFVKGGYFSKEMDSSLIQFGYKQVEDTTISSYVVKVVEQ